MSYSYATQRPFVFTEDGQVMFLSIRDKARKLMVDSACAMLGKIISGQTGEVWNMMACVDRLVELNELKEIPNPISSAGQHRIFTNTTCFP